MRLHHVTSGDSTAGALRQAVPGTVSVWADVLHEGPVLAGLSHEQMCSRRSRYLADAGYGAFEDISTAFREWQAALKRPSCDELVLWFEHDLFDQLNLIQLLDWLASSPRDATLSLVSIDAFPGRTRFRGMGELGPDEIATLFPGRQPVTAAQVVLAQRAWQAFRATSPAALEQLLAEDTSVLPFLAPSLQRQLDELPSATSGLSRTEERLLRILDGGEADVRRVFERMGDDERYFFIGDSSFWTIVLGLATCTPALIDVEIASVSSGALPRAAARLTHAGRDVLAGRVDRVALCGLDRWIGGMHLTPASAWRRSPRVGTRPAAAG